MSLEQLKAIQGPLKDKYKAHPEAALSTLRATGQAFDGVSCKVETGRALVEAGLHSAIGGDETLTLRRSPEAHVSRRVTQVSR